ncbi:uncharacterized protein TNCV_2857581 [Trichonephila clavipes]|nr:uncharacterized protein TNCV_2857581 [Trichonephila clavipes]
MPRASTKVFKKRRGVFNKGRCNKSNDGCGESNSTVPKNSADEKNCADGAKLCTNETKPSASERKIVNMDISYSDEAFSGFRNVIVDINLLACVFFEAVKCIKQQEKSVNTVWQKLFVKPLMKNDGKRDLAVAVDGSWQKRGFSSKNGLVTVTSVDTGKVIDVEVFFKTLYLSEQNRSIFKIVREIFEGYSGKMEVAGALSIFQRSQSLYNVRYTKYLGDGDSKAFTSIVENKVYGDHCSVEKLECIGHVMKRMGTRLRRLKTKMRGQKLSDGKPLCGRNRLTEAEIDRLQAYYGLAIRRNLSSVKDMQQAIRAIFLHKLSTDEKPQHGF